MSKRIFIIPDTQVRPGVPTDHFDWLGQAIADYKPDQIIHLGDHWDFSSISRHMAVGSREAEGQRLLKDVQAGNMALERLQKAQEGFRAKRSTLLMGNHEKRLETFLEASPVLEGILGMDMLNTKQLGWEFVPYFHGSPKVTEIEGIYFAHYFTNINTGRPIGGNAAYKLNAIGSPYVQGHVQGYDIGTKQFATGRTIRGITIGSCYLHDEPYKGAANAHWRGAIVLNEVEKGGFSEMPLTMDYLCRKYEGMGISRFLQRKYKNAKQRFTLAN